MGNPHSIRKGSEAVEKNAVSALVSSDLAKQESAFDYSAGTDLLYCI